MDDSLLRRGKLLGAAAALSRYLRRHFPEHRIGIVLPASKGGVVANLAVVLAGKVPVGLNFTSGKDALQRAQQVAGLKTAISANAFANRLTDFPWPDNVIQLDELLPRLKAKIFLWWMAAIFLPAPLLDSAARNPAGRGPCRSGPSLYQRQLRRSERRRPESSQPPRQRLAISRPARCDAGRFDPRLAPVFPQLWLHRHALVSADRWRPHRHLSRTRWKRRNARS